jgi:tetraacyldisaccharide 4'-kinase
MDPVGTFGNPERYLALIGGQRRGIVATVLRGGLWCLSLGYGLAVRWRNQCYDWGWKRTHRVHVPVVSVGNLSVGGTGKTPFVEWVARFFREREYLVAILSRGYGAQGGRNDEALVLEENLPDVPHLQGADRVALAQSAIEECESEVLVLDDGFQHRRLARDIDIVLIDTTATYEHLLPRGLMREPFSSLRRADAIVLTRCDQAVDLQGSRSRLERLAPGKPIAETIHAPTTLANTHETKPLDTLTLQRVAAFCGIGNPEAFRQTLTSLGAQIVDFRTYADHHAYTREDVNDLAHWAATQPADAWVITTQKDWVKLQLDQLGGRPVWALRVSLDFRAGKQALEALLTAAMTVPGQGGPIS